MRGIFERPLASGVWWVSYFDSAGKWHREKVGRRSAAITAYHARKREIREGLFIAPLDRRAKVSFKELLEQAIDAKRGRNAHLTVLNDEWRKAKLIDAFGSMNAGAIDSVQIEAWLKGILATGVCGATVNRYRSLISSIFSYGIRTGRLTENPVAKVLPYKETSRRVRFLSHKEEAFLRRQIRKTCPWHEPDLDLALNTGMRRGEQFSLTWEKVDLERGILTVSGKTGQRFIPINAVAAKALRKLRRISQGSFVSGGKAGKRDWRRWFERCVRAAEIPNFTWHDLRHTFASRLVMAGVDIRTVQELLGHRSIVMTMRYSHLSQPHLKSALDALCRPPESLGATQGMAKATYTRNNTGQPKRKSKVLEVA